MTSSLDVETPLEPARQQPDWGDPALVSQVRRLLAGARPLVRPEDVDDLRSQLARAARHDVRILQAGDCAEDPAECTAETVRRKARLLDRLARTLEGVTGCPTLRVGRIAGQFAKPRSAATETVDGMQLPVYRGHLVNGPDPDPRSRRPDPLRMLSGFLAAERVMTELDRSRPGQTTGQWVWTSHEALLLDYERPLVREHEGRRWLSSTHWPWIGERTRQPDGPHVALLAEVANPVACKVGPSMTPGDIVELCARLDPGREPGRLAFIARMGAGAVDDLLPRLVEAVRSAGHPVLWLCDPMHGNTVTAYGRKTRVVSTVIAEVRGFRRAVEHGGGVAAGLHLETSVDDVAECVADASVPAGGAYRSLCDPRLSPAQAVDVVTAWSSLDRFIVPGGAPHAGRL